MDFSAAFASINYLAVLVGAAGMFILGAVWYSPVLFAKSWMKELNFSEEDLKDANMAMTFLGSFIMMLIMAFVLAMFLGDVSLTDGAIAGALVGLGWVTTSMAINYLYEQRSIKLLFINAGYQVLGLTIMGAVLGAW